MPGKLLASGRDGDVFEHGAPLHGVFARLVLREFDRAAVVPFRRPVAESRARDRNTRPGEVRAMQRLVEREEHRAARRDARS